MGKRKQAGFSDLVFGPSPLHAEWVKAKALGLNLSIFAREPLQAFHFFPNGYGVSVVTGGGSYTDSKYEYELAVIEGKPGAWSLCYTTPVTSNVIGHLTGPEVTEIMRRVAELGAS